MKTRAFRRVCLALACCLLLGLTGCGGGKLRYDSATYGFDTQITLTAYCAGQEEFQELRGLLFGRLGQLHQKFDIYHEYDGQNNLCTLNQNAGRPVELDGEILDLLEFCQEIRERTQGLVNPAMGSLLSLWHTARETGRLPREEDIRQAMDHGDMADLAIDRAAGTACLLDPEMALDVGAVAKGWSVQRAAEAADAAGYTDYVLSAGGNVVVRGQAGDRPWRVGIRDPQSSDSQASILTLEPGEGALVTSGGYERSLTVEGRTYCHIIDPDTGYPADRVLSATVICPDSGLGDGLSTALFLMEPEAGLAFAREQGVRAVIVDLTGRVLDSEAP